MIPKIDEVRIDYNDVVYKLKRWHFKSYYIDINTLPFNTKCNTWCSNPPPRYYNTRLKFQFFWGYKTQIKPPNVLL
jgi:hypothetical protein